MVGDERMIGRSQVGKGIDKQLLVAAQECCARQSHEARNSLWTFSCCLYEKLS